MREGQPIPESEIHRAPETTPNDSATETTGASTVRIPDAKMQARAKSGEDRVRSMINDALFGVPKPTGEISLESSLSRKSEGLLAAEKELADAEIALAALGVTDVKEERNRRDKHSILHAIGTKLSRKSGAIAAALKRYDDAKNDMHRAA